MAKRTESAFTEQPRTGGRHLAREGAAKTPEEPKGPEKQAPRRKKRSEEQPAEKTATAPGKRREAVRRGDLPPVRLPAKPGLARKRMADAAQVDAETFYRHFVPYIEEAHHRNERSLKAGVWLLALLPAILAVVRELTDASRIVFLIFWIIGMFGIATALIFTAYADHDLKKTLEELKELVPPEEEIELVAESNGKELTFVLSDKGKEFDPTMKEDADPNVNPMERDIGGMGIYIVKNIMNQVTYQRLEGKNLLTMKKEI